MIVSMKKTAVKTVVMIILALALLAGLLGWTMRAGAMPSTQQFHTGIHSSQMLADGGPGCTCPPPPRVC